MGRTPKVRTASTIKLPILAALESLVAAGKVKWDERIALKPGDKVSGSGVLSSLADNTDLTVRNLAILMIIVSDNTATNLILDRITADAVNDYLDTIGLTVDALEPQGPRRRHEARRADRLEQGRPEGREREVRTRRVHAARDGEAARDAPPGQDRQPRGVERHPRDHEGSADQGRHRPPRAATDWTVASKSGSLDALRSDVGIVYTKSGPIAMAITVDGMPVTDYSPDNVGDILISKLAQVIVEGLMKCDCE